MIGPGVAWYLSVAAFLFGTGSLGVLLRRNPLIVLLSLEIMLNGANLALIGFARNLGDGSGQIFALAVMAVAVHGILAIRDFAPHRVGNELVLRLARPLDIAIGVPVVCAEDFLQKKDVGRQAVQALLHLVDDHPPGEVRETLVNVVGRDSKTHR